MTRHVLHTERLILRPLDSKDAPAIHRLAGAKEISDTTLTVPYPYPFHAAVEWIEKAHREWKAKTAFVFAITLRETKEFIGGIGLHLTPQDQNAEMGFWVGTPFWNLGYCSEAGKEMMRFGFETLQLHRIFARHFPRNLGSGRVMIKLGMKYEGHLREHVRKLDHFEDVLCYGILKDEWEDLTAKAPESPS
jgi:RimJ/RimL family protein N-acetyltransferase